MTHATHHLVGRMPAALLELMAPLASACQDTSAAHIPDADLSAFSALTAPGTRLACGRSALTLALESAATRLGATSSTTARFALAQRLCLEIHLSSARKCQVFNKFIAKI